MELGLVESLYFRPYRIGIQCGGKYFDQLPLGLVVVFFIGKTKRGIVQRILPDIQGIFRVIKIVQSAAQRFQGIHRQGRRAGLSYPTDIFQPFLRLSAQLRTNARTRQQALVQIFRTRQIAAQHLDRSQPIQYRRIVFSSLQR